MMTRNRLFLGLLSGVLLSTAARADYTIHIVETLPGGGAASQTTTYSTTSPDDDFVWTRYDAEGWVIDFKLEMLNGAVVETTVSDIELSDGGSAAISWSASVDESSATGTLEITSGEGEDDYLIVFTGDFEQTIRVVDYESLERMFGSVFVDSAPDDDSYLLFKTCECKTDPPTATCSVDDCANRITCAGAVRCGWRWGIS